MKTLLDFMETMEEKDIDTAFMEYFMMLFGAKKSLDRLKEYLNHTSKEMVRKEELLNLLNNSHTEIDDFMV